MRRVPSESVNRRFSVRSMRAGPRVRSASMFTANRRTMASTTPVVVIRRLDMRCFSSVPVCSALFRAHAALRHSITTALTNSQNTMSETK